MFSNSTVTPAPEEPSGPSADFHSRTDRGYSVGVEPRDVDVCLYMFALCRQLQTLYLEPHGVDCLFDVDDVGSMPDTVCRLLGAIVCELVNDVTGATPEGGRVAITVRRRATSCVCAVSHAGPVDPWQDTRAGLGRVQHIARDIHAHCRAQRSAGARTVAVLFDIPSASAAFRRHCAGHAIPAG